MNRTGNHNRNENDKRNRECACVCDGRMDGMSQGESRYGVNAMS